jgi:hypothetical protein
MHAASDRQTVGARNHMPIVLPLPAVVSAELPELNPALKAFLVQLLMHAHDNARHAACR